MNTAAASPAPVKEGDILAGKYRVEKVLGVGGMGVVVAAHHVDLDQKVALKFLLPTAAVNDELVGRFLREARASVRLKGTHVAKVLDVGRLEDNCPYIVMEFLEGRDLHAEMKVKDRLPVAIEDAMSWVVQAAEGLAEAHSLGIIHRDLKPGNLFLTRGVDGRPLVKVLDFGISKTIDQSIAGEGASLTKTEMLLGSPLYMSPEQMRSSKHVDERSDLWALGAIAYELLTGHVPFEADTILELCFKVAQEKAPSPKEHRPDLPDALCTAILRCLEKDPNARFQNVGEVARAFEPFASPRDRGTAERALEVLGTGKRKPAHSLPAPDEIGPVTPPPGSSPALTPPISALAVTPGPALAPRPPSQGEIGGAAWGGTHAQSKSPLAQRSTRNLIAIGAAVAVIAAVGGVIASRSGGTRSDLPSGLSANANAVPNPPPPAIELPSPPATGMPDEPAPAAKTDTTSGAATATAAAAQPASKGGRPPSTPGTTPPSAKSGKAAASAAAPPPAASPAAAPPAPAPPSSGFIRVRE